MSIFKYTDIDNVLFTFLAIKDKCHLSRVNSYYRNKLHEELIHFYLFFTETSPYVLHRLTYGYAPELMIRAIRYGILAICKYIKWRYCDNIDNKLFRENLAYIYKNGFEIASIHEYYDILNWLLSINNGPYNIDFCIQIAIKEDRQEMVNFLRKIDF